VQTERTGIVPLPAGSTYDDVNNDDLDYVVSVSYNAGSYYFARLRPEQ